MEIAEFASIGEKIMLRVRKFQFGTKAQLAFLEDFYVLVNDGIPANRAIEMMASATEGVNKEVALSISSKISQGQALAEGMNEWFGINIVEIIRVGEEGGALVETLGSAIKTLGQQSGAIGEVVKAVSYPLLVIVMACAIIVYLNSSVFVQFRAIKPFDKWPDAGKQLVYIAQLIEGWWWLVIVSLIVIAIVLKRLMNNYIGELRPLLDKIPPFSLYRRFAAARFLETLGLLVANGVVFKSAIKVLQYQANPYLSSHLVIMEHLLSSGKGNVADVLSTGLIDKQSILRLRVMAEVKGFEHGLIRMGVRGAEDATKTLAKVSKIIGGLLLVTGGVLIVVIIKGIYLTGMSMSQT